MHDFITCSLLVVLDLSLVCRVYESTLNIKVNKRCLSILTEDDKAITPVSKGLPAKIPTKRDIKTLNRKLDRRRHFLQPVIKRHISACFGANRRGVVAVNATGPRLHMRMSGPHLMHALRRFGRWPVHPTKTPSARY